MKGSLKANIFSFILIISGRFRECSTVSGCHFENLETGETMNSVMLTNTDAVVSFVVPVSGPSGAQLSCKMRFLAIGGGGQGEIGGGGSGYIQYRDIVLQYNPE